MSLRDEAIKAQYVSECLTLVNGIEKRNAADIQTVLIKAANTALHLQGVPPVTSREDVAVDAYGQFDFQTWAVIFGKLLTGTPSVKILSIAVNTVYHEARHCEQWFRMIQAVNRKDVLGEMFNPVDSSSKSSIALRMHVPENIVEKAILDASYHGDERAEILRWWDSTYGRSGGIRGVKLHNIQNRYEGYLNLPEEVDARHVGNTAEEMFRTQCPRLDCPTFDYWKTATKLGWLYERSDKLEKVDDALEAYLKDRNPATKKVLADVFKIWNDLKPNTKRAKGPENVVLQLKEFLGL